MIMSFAGPDVKRVKSSSELAFVEGISIEANSDNRDSKGRFVSGNGFRWRPGQSGNQFGRRESLADLLARIGDETDDSGMTRREREARYLRGLILDRSLHTSMRLKAAEVVYCRELGQPKAKVEVTTDERFAVCNAIDQLMVEADISRDEAIQLLKDVGGVYDIDRMLGDS